MTAPVDIFNMALDAINARASVASINPSDGSAAGDWGARNYQLRIDALSRAAHWNCLRRQSPGLTLLKAMQGTPENPNGTTLPQPPQPWLYEYGLPADLIKARYIPPLVPVATTTPPIMSQTAVLPPLLFTDTMIPFVIAIDTDANNNLLKVLLTNQQQAQLVYTARIADCDLWDSGFQTGAIGTLAAWAQLPLSGSLELAKLQIALVKGVLDEARRQDGNEGRTTVDHVPDWIQVRGASSFQGGSANLWVPWDTMAFPSGPPY